MSEHPPEYNYCSYNHVEMHYNKVLLFIVVSVIVHYHLLGKFEGMQIYQHIYHQLIQLNKGCLSDSAQM